MKKRIFLILAVWGLTGVGFAAPKETPKERLTRHYLDLYGFGGVSHWNYPLEGGVVRVGVGFGAGAGYTFFFHPNVGLQTGLSFSRIGSTARLTEPMEWSQGQDGSALTDYMGDRYLHRTAFEGWKEQEQAYLIEVPLGLRFRFFKDQDSRVGLHAALGVKAAMPVWASYRNGSGKLTHTGWYEQWQLLLHDLPGRFETEQLPAHEESMTRRLRTINAGLYAEIGAAIRLNVHYELSIAAFGQYIVNDLNGTPQKERRALGFRTEKNGYPFMNEYRGLIGTEKVGAIHPWMAGVKVGLSIWPGKTDKEKQKELKKLMRQYPEMAVREVVHDTIFLHDTICPEPSPQGEGRCTVYGVGCTKEEAPTAAQETLDSLLSGAVIWFHWDEYVPILEPAYILDSVAAMMHRHPSLRIHVNGHACRLGTDRYNQRLALLRAKAVAELLEQKGISADRMFIWSYGAKRPFRYNSKKQLSKDRRVEIIPD